MGYQVELINFEGPLDLLLQLIEKSTLDITDISLAGVTQQYLSYLDKLHDLDPAELNQFIELAAKLIHIKSQAILPSRDDETYEEDLEDLTRQLAEYRTYQKASRYLQDLIKQGQPSWSRRAPKPQASQEAMPLPDVTGEHLREIFEAAIARMPRLPERELDQQITIEEATTQLKTALRKDKEVYLHHIIQSLTNRTEAVVMFLSVLELLRTNQISVRQDQAFGDIILIDG